MPESLRIGLARPDRSAIFIQSHSNCNELLLVRRDSINELRVLL